MSVLCVSSLGVSMSLFWCVYKCVCKVDDSRISQNITETISTNSQQVMGPEVNGFRGIISVTCSAKGCQLPNLVPDGLN